MKDESTERTCATMDRPLNYTDHDLLIRIDTRLDGLFNDFGDLKKEIHRLWVEKASKSDIAECKKTDEDHESRIRAVERRIWIAIGGLAVIEVGIGVLLHYWK